MWPGAARGSVQVGRPPTCSPVPTYSLHQKLARAFSCGLEGLRTWHQLRCECHALVFSATQHESEQHRQGATFRCCSDSCCVAENTSDFQHFNLHNSQT